MRGGELEEQLARDGIPYTFDADVQAILLLHPFVLHLMHVAPFHQSTWLPPPCIWNAQAR